MKRLAVLVCALALCAAPVFGADDETPAPLGTRAAQLPGVRVVDRVVAGRALAAAVLPQSMGNGLAVLILPLRADGSEDGAGNDADGAEHEDGHDEKVGRPRQLWAISADVSEPPKLLAGDLPGTLKALELHRGGAGRPDELWLGGDGVVYRLDAERGMATPILAAPGLDLAVLEQTGLLEADGGVAIPELGRLRLLDADLRETAVHPLPVAAERRSSGLVLSSPHVVRPRAAGMPFYVGPEPQGATRLLVRVIEPGAEAGGDSGPEAAEAWIRLPSPEDVERSKFIVLDGIPRLAVTTTDAEKLGIFEEMGFRLYSLRPDRTRAGVGPLLEVQTQTKHWYSVGIEVADLDCDGKDDLALLQPEGMGAGDLLIDVYLGLGDGRVSAVRHRRSKLDAPDASWHWGDDFTGDGVPDLFIASREQIELLPGDKDHRSRVVAKKPAWTWTPAELKSAMRKVDGEDGDTPSGHYTRVGTIRAHDADGDGDLDLSLAWSADGRVVVRFVLPD